MQDKLNSSISYVGEGAEFRLMVNQQMFDPYAFGEKSVKNESIVMSR